MLRYILVLAVCSPQMSLANDNDVAGSRTTTVAVAAPSSEKAPAGSLKASCEQKFTENKCEAIISEAVTKGAKRSDYLNCNSIVSDTVNTCGGSFVASAGISFLTWNSPLLATAASVSLGALATGVGGYLMYKGYFQDEECSKDIEAKKLMARQLIAYYGEEDPAMVAMLQTGCAELRTNVAQKVRALQAQISTKETKIERQKTVADARQRKGLPQPMEFGEKLELTPAEKSFLFEGDLIKKEGEKLKGIFSELMSKNPCGSSSTILATACSLVGGVSGMALARDTARKRFKAMIAREAVRPTDSVAAAERSIVEKVAQIKAAGPEAIKRAEDNLVRSAQDRYRLNEIVAKRTSGSIPADIPGEYAKKPDAFKLYKKATADDIATFGHRADLGYIHIDGKLYQYKYVDGKTYHPGLNEQQNGIDREYLRAALKSTSRDLGPNVHNAWAKNTAYEFRDNNILSSTVGKGVSDNSVRLAEQGQPQKLFQEVTQLLKERPSYLTEKQFIRLQAWQSYEKLPLEVQKQDLDRLMNLTF